MSTYGLVAADLEGRLDAERLVELTDDEANPAGVRNDAVIDEAIGRAESEFDSYAGKLYPVPVAPVSVFLKDKLLDSAAYFLMTRKPEHLSDKAPEGNYWIRMRKEYVVWLEDVRSGTAALVGVTAAPPASAAGKAEVLTDTPRFSNLTTLMNGG